MKTKVCPKCKREKTIDCFTPKGWECRQCQRERRQDRIRKSNVGVPVDPFTDLHAWSGDV